VPEELVRAIKRILQGGRYVSSFLAERLASRLGTQIEKSPLETLSDREDQVMRMIGFGKTTTQIAQELSLSVKTASAHRSRILKKIES
jgi:two-component system, NarL family, invasion response regulator UvrY